jgi:hypothetical protein
MLLEINSKLFRINSNNNNESDDDLDDDSSEESSNDDQPDSYNQDLKDFNDELSN